MTPKKNAPSGLSNGQAAGKIGLHRRLAGARLSWRVLLIGSMAWALVLSASAVLHLLRDGWTTDEAVRRVGLLYGLGGLIAFPPGLVAARLLSHARAESAFAAAFLALAAASIGATGMLFALQYRFYYASWHGAPFSVEWIFQFIFTTLAALYQFLVLGVRLFFPLGLMALFAVSLWHARAKR